MIDQLIDELNTVQNDLDARLATIHLLVERAMTSRDPETVKACRDQIKDEIAALNQSAAQMYEIGQDISNRRTESMLRGWMLVVVLIIGLLLGVLPAVAQDMATNTPAGGAVVVLPVEATEEAPVETRPDADMVSRLLEQYSVIMPWVVSIVLLALLALTTVGSVGIIQAAKLAPEWALRGAVSAGEGILTEARDYVETTETTVDDYILAEFDKRFDALKRELGLVTGQAPPGTPLTAPKVPQYDEGAG